MTTTNGKSERQEIHDTIMATYHQAHVDRDPDLLRQVLHPEWRFFRIDADGQFCAHGRDEYIGRYETPTDDAPQDWETEIYSIDVTGDFASVKLRIECSLAKCIDYFNMMRLDGRWWIVHKISHGELKRTD